MVCATTMQPLRIPAVSGNRKLIVHRLFVNGSIARPRCSGRRPFKNSGPRIPLRRKTRLTSSFDPETPLRINELVEPPFGADAWRHLLWALGKSTCCSLPHPVAVLRKYEHKMAFDAEGRKLCAYHQSVKHRQSQLREQAKAGDLPSEEVYLKLYEQHEEDPDSIDWMGFYTPPFTRPDRSRNDAGLQRIPTPPRRGEYGTDMDAKTHQLGALLKYGAQVCHPDISAGLREDPEGSGSCSTRICQPLVGSPTPAVPMRQPAR